MKIEAFSCRASLNILKLFYKSAISEGFMIFYVLCPYDKCSSFSYYFTRQEKCVMLKPANAPPAQILCLLKEHRSRPWQPAFLFTYPVCRHMIAMTTISLLCQFSSAIVSLCRPTAPFTCCFSSSLLILPLILRSTSCGIHIIYGSIKVYTHTRTHTRTDALISFDSKALV